MLLHTNVGIIQNRKIVMVSVTLLILVHVHSKAEMKGDVQTGMDFYKAFNFCPRAELSTCWPSVNFVLHYRWTVFRLNYTLREHF